MNKITITSVIILVFSLLSLTTSKKPSKKQALKVLNGFCAYVPSGNTVLDSDTLSVHAFFMSKGEITNIQYREFLFYLKQHNQLEEYKIAQVDTAKWTEEFGFMDAYAEYYHNHPAYHSHPVVNITKEAAELYCEWLTMMYDSISGGELNITFRIPTRAEWIHAARSNNQNTPYSWGHYSLTNSEGEPLANYVRLGAENITRNNESGKMEVVSFPIPNDYFNLNDSPDILAPSESYWPNDYGFYNMNGNAAEMISDGDYAVGGSWHSPGYDIRNESIEDFIEASPFVGFRIVASYVREEK